MTDQVTSLTSQAQTDIEVNRQILIESLTLLYRSMPSAALGHFVAVTFIIFALYESVALSPLLIWGGSILVMAAIRVAVTTFVERRIMDAEIGAISKWANMLAALAFIQTSIWGASVFAIWPDDIGYRSFLIALLAGIVAAGGIMLALHRNSFYIYCLPITIPAVIQLCLGGSQLELLLATLLIFYSGLLYFSVNRLTNVFLEGLKLRFQMQTESRTDALTSLANRRGFDESLHDIWQQSIRSKQSIGLLVLDVDYFKNYNDYYGHPQGDIALRKLGELFLKVASRSTDLCARIGGEEFAVLMPATELEGSQQVANAIMEELLGARIPHRNSKNGFLTVSIGLNVIQPTRGSTADTFVMETDQALYEAKETGRNRISIALSVINKAKADDENPNL
ncbi:MAG: GGDEF domain-containing protein [Gammaproteobacteria bacterium]|jgi:diguanylate cyclase (GGDEF)-like protein|nr:GGDEF domain-containing protein [Gammaproteobacteria bacterium]